MNRSDQKTFPEDQKLDLKVGYLKKQTNKKVSYLNNYTLYLGLWRGPTYALQFTGYEVIAEGAIGPEI